MTKTELLITFLKAEFHFMGQGELKCKVACKYSSPTDLMIIH